MFEREQASDKQKENHKRGESSQSEGRGPCIINKRREFRKTTPTCQAPPSEPLTAMAANLPAEPMGPMGPMTPAPTLGQRLRRADSRHDGGLKPPWPPRRIGAQPLGWDILSNSDVRFPHQLDHFGMVGDGWGEAHAWICQDVSSILYFQPT